ncbi:MAG: Ig-like domain-containing protein [Marinoscillum sp.]
MRLFLICISLVILFDLLTFRCANPINPTGGPKDTIPPVLVRSIPEDQSLNFKGQEIYIEFNEAITADKLKQNLIITPIDERKYKTLLKKESATIRFEEPFEDSTTYTFNFFDGITDITEKNPAENLILAFSTGNFIDSLTISGYVTNLMSGEIPKKITVGLYRITDTLDFEAIKPTYFTTIDEEGFYKIQNIKNTKYRLFAFNDDNRNLLFDAAKESFGFYADTLQMSAASGDTIDLNMITLDVSKLKFISARPSGRYYEVRYTKPVTKYDFTTHDSLYIPTKLVDENKTLRFYNTDIIADSTRTYLTVYDSLGNSITDTLFVKFRESSRKPESYSVALKPPSGKTVTLETKYAVVFSKPTMLLDSQFLSIPIDTFFTLGYQANNVRFNNLRNELYFNLDITAKTYQDSLNSIISSIVIDSTNIDTAQFLLKRKLEQMTTSAFSLTINSGAFLSVENDTSKQIQQSYKFLDPAKVGLVRVKIETDEPSYTVQLMSKTESVASQTNCTTCTFSQLQPGEYWVRILIDANQDGEWSLGNYRKNIAPEPVVHFTETTVLRANFEIELICSF